MVYTTEIREHNGLKYRIEMRRNTGIWQQRHIWYPTPESHFTEITADRWIRSIQVPPDGTFRKVRHSARGKRSTSMKKFPGTKEVKTAIDRLRELGDCPDCQAVASWLEHQAETKQRREEAITQALSKEQLVGGDA